jgi:chloramphenicol-sensitive protein RarD
VSEERRRSGLLFGAGAYIWWGLSPGFFLLLLPATAPEILAHRFVWSAAMLLVLLAVVRRLGDLRTLSARTWLQLLAASAFIALNWGAYIWAVTHGHVVDAALGYFINPLVTVALGVVIFRERLNRWQLLALILAVGAVAILTAEVGDVPYVALILAFTFGFYGLVKKVVDADPRVSVTVETLWALPFAVGFLAWLQATDQAHFVNYGVGHTLLLLLAGPVTAIPLLLFAAAAQRLPMVTLGVLFYLNPGLQMAWGCSSDTNRCRPADGSGSRSSGSRW